MLWKHKSAYPKIFAKSRTTGPPVKRVLPKFGGSALKTGRREMPGSNPSRAFRSNRSEFSVVFSKTRLNTGQDPL